MTETEIFAKSNEEYQALVKRAKACTLCKSQLPQPPNPVFSAPASAKVVIIGQAPGIKAHKSSKPWNDKSGDRLRTWLGISSHTFYESGYVALIPMGFCFPGYRNGADAPPRKECAPAWHAPLLHFLQPKLTILVGRYAQHYYMPEFKSLTDAVAASPRHNNNMAVLPHPSGRNNRWLGRHPWFEETILPSLATRVSRILPKTC